MLAADQMEKHANLFVNEGEGKIFQDKINSTREALLNLVKPDPTDTAFNIKNNDVYNNVLASCQLWAKEPTSGKGDWVSQNLEHVPASGVMAVFI